MLPVPTGYWSIFALSAEDSHSSNRSAVSFLRRTIVSAVAGALADAHSANHAPPSAEIDDALRSALVRLDEDARTGQPWARDASRAEALLAFFDSESRVLRIANTGAGCAFLGRRIGGSAAPECTELAGPGSPGYIELEPARTRRLDVEELVDEGVFKPRGTLDASSVEMRSVEVRDGDFLVLGSESAWDGMDGTEAVQAVSAWVKEQEEPASERASRERRRWPHVFDFPREHEEDDGFGLGSGWVGAMIPVVMRDFDAMVGRSRGNPASCVLRRDEPGRREESSSSSVPGTSVVEHTDLPTSSSG